MKCAQPASGSSGPECPPSDDEQRYRLRSTAAQCYVTFVNCISFTVLGMLLISPTTVNGYLTNSSGPLSLTQEQASWYGSLLLLVQPLGCLFGGFLQTFIGRRVGLILMNVLSIMSWISLYKAESVSMLYICSALMGISIGFVEAPGVTYTSEICEPRIRGTMISCTNLAANSGLMINMFLTWIFDWRTAALISTSLPLSSIIFLWKLPESPIWLLNRGDDVAALKSLRWLRGWVPEEHVINEFRSIKNHIAETYSAELGSEKQSKAGFKIKYLLESSTVRPFLLLMGVQIFANCGAAQGTRNYIIEILKEVDLPWSPQTIAFIISVTGVAGNLVGVVSIGILGKRFLSIFGMILCSLTFLTLGICIQNKTSVSPYNFAFLFYCGNFLSFTGVILQPWIYLAEIYPTKTRSVATAITGAMFYIIMSFFTKTYTNLQNLIQTSGCYIVYGVLGLLGGIYLWIFLPETEGKSLAEIEDYFSGKSKKIAINKETNTSRL